MSQYEKTWMRTGAGRRFPESLRPALLFSITQGQEEIGDAGRNHGDQGRKGIQPLKSGCKAETSSQHPQGVADAVKLSGSASFPGKLADGLAEGPCIEQGISNAQPQSSHRLPAEKGKQDCNG